MGVRRRLGWHAIFCVRGWAGARMRPWANGGWRGRHVVVCATEPAAGARRMGAARGREDGFLVDAPGAWGARDGAGAARGPGRRGGAGRPDGRMGRGTRREFAGGESLDEVDEGLEEGENVGRDGIGNAAEDGMVVRPVDDGLAESLDAAAQFRCRAGHRTVTGLR